MLLVEFRTVRASASAALALDTKCIVRTLSIECGITAGARPVTLGPGTEPDGPCNQPAPWIKYVSLHINLLCIITTHHKGSDADRTHHHNTESSVKLCKVVCEFFAPLLKAAKVDLPANLLQTTYVTVLTKRLLYYNKDLQKKAWSFVYCSNNQFVNYTFYFLTQVILVRFLTTLFEINSCLMFVLMKKKAVTLEACNQANNFKDSILSSKRIKKWIKLNKVLY